MNFTCLTEAEVLAGAKIEDNCLILGDCEKVLPFVPKCDAVISDPPYGINKDGQIKTTGGHGGRKGYEFKNWDSSRPGSEIFNLILSAAKTCMLWGGNYFADLLPPTKGWLVWDKGQRINQSDGELAWTSQDVALRIMTMNRVELMIDGAQHPTQKPLKLMKWCISQCKNDPQTILDPFMGSGTTCVAAIEMGRKFIGIEREPSYFEIAKRRCEEAFWRCDKELKSKPGEVDLWNFDKQEAK